MYILKLVKTVLGDIIARYIMVFVFVPLLDHSNVTLMVST